MHKVRLCIHICYSVHCIYIKKRRSPHEDAVNCCLVTSATSSKVGTSLILYERYDKSANELLLRHSKLNCVAPDWDVSKE